MRIFEAIAAAIAGAALATLPGGAGIWTAIIGTSLGAAAGIAFSKAEPSPRPLIERLAPLVLLAFFIPAFTKAVAPGTDMAMHVALARGILQGDGALSPAWGAVHAAVYPRGFSALVALLAPFGLARAGLLAAGISYLVFWAGLAAVLKETPWPRTVALLALLIARLPQSYFDWGGNPTALALGLSLLAAARLETPLLSALLLAGAAAVHPMGACAGALVLGVIAVQRRAWLPGVAASTALFVILSILALFGPHLSPREVAWIRNYAATTEQVLGGFWWRILGDAGTALSLASLAILLWKRQYKPALFGSLATVALCVLFAVLPLAGLYPARFAPLLLVIAGAWWGRAAALVPSKLVAALASAVGIACHVQWYQRSFPLVTFEDLQAIGCVQRTVPPGEVIEGGTADASQWIPALAGRAVTHPQQHCSLFDEIDAALLKLPVPRWKFAADGRAPLCNGRLEEKLRDH